MFLAMGVGAFASGIFHLYTHAFFKGLLFLGSGSVIHALGGEQDLRRMGGLKDDLPITYWTFLVGAVAIAGVPGLAGFFSKDEILYRAFASGHTILWALGLFTSLLTAIYMFRLVFLVFHGPRRAQPAQAAGPHSPAAGSAGHGGAPGEHGGALHDAPPAMAAPLLVLAAGSVLAGYVGLPALLGGSDRFARFLEPSFAGGLAVEGAGAERLEGILMIVSALTALAGIGLAFRFFLRSREAADKLAERFAGLHRLLLRKYYVDEVYDAALVQPVRIVSEALLWKTIDARIIDGAVNGVGNVVSGWSLLLGRLQTGSVRVYAAALFLGTVLVLGFYLSR
jgi:NADH-quinone oxidoreductase subunit L